MGIELRFTSPRSGRIGIEGIAGRGYSLQAGPGRSVPGNSSALTMTELESGSSSDGRSVGGADDRQGSSARRAFQIGGSIDATDVFRDHLYLVFSGPPADLTDDEYGEWYAQHVRENVGNSPQIPRGWMFHLDGTDRDRGDGFTHLALYELDGDSVTMLAGLNGMVDRGEITLPSWFSARRRAGGFDAFATGPEVTNRA